MKEKTLWKFISVILILCFIFHSITFERGWFLYLGGYMIGFPMIFSILEASKLDQGVNSK